MALIAACSLLGECLFAEHTSDTSTNYDSFLNKIIELLVRRIWFGQSKLYFILKWLVMRCKLRPELAADAQQTA